ncbi:VOC family protein [Streptomyces sp. NPDC046977]|uniref:VOC family protein n=1 Tax=Streptomyces sp. NPDC046977 TaxID=3154703 RepID=UPI0033F0E793
MITTDFVPGSPCWVDLGAPDVDAAAAFYGAVFGWDFERFALEDADFGLFRLHGRTVGAVGRLTEEGARPAWMIYFRALDVEVTTWAAMRAGASVRREPHDVQDAGRLAQLTDPLGAEFAVWQPRGTQGFGTADLPGSLCWTELYTTDAAAAKEFYGSLFGWKTDDMPLPGGSGATYTVITPAGESQERMQGGLMEMAPEFLTLNDGRPYWHPVFAAENCDDAVARVTGNGGALQMGPEDAEGVGRLAVCLDPAGADFVLLTPAPPA